MTSVTPVAMDYLPVKFSSLKHCKLVAAMDKGCSLVKILYASREHYAQAVSKSEETEAELIITCALYHNRDFALAIDEFLKNVHMPEDAAAAVLRVTGAGCDKEIEMLREKTPFQVQFVDEFVSQAKGNYWLMTNVSDENFCYPIDEFGAEGILPESQEGLWLKFGEKLKLEEGHCVGGAKLPCLIAFLGSGGGFVKLNESGECKLTGGHRLAGKSFIGLSRLILGTRDYNEITALAAAGDRRNVDTQMFEIIQSGSSYGTHDPLKPLFSFGKPADYDKGLEDYKKEDLAASLLSAFTSNLVASIGGYARTEKVKSIYFGGNFVRAPIVRKLIHQHASLILSKLFNIRFVKIGHTAALGALVADPNNKII